MTTRPLFRLAVICALLCSTATSFAASDLETGFVSPPDSARPWVYWFWLNGNITREGITADLEAMKRVGIGGALIMEVDQGAPLGPVGFMSAEWRDLFKHVAAEAQRLGLEINMNNDAGWNGSGGPWIKPEQSMQKIVWKEADVEGPRRFEGVISQPETVAGFYRDIAVLAFPAVGSYRIPNLHAKGAYGIGAIGAPTQDDLAKEMIVERGRVLDISEHMHQAGRVTWDVPTGKWTIVRLGHTSTGVQNAPAPESGRGLECDKLSKEGVEANFDGMMAKLVADVGPAVGKALVATHVDSWENGSQNWTARMREEFSERRGYDMFGFLPAMTGRVVDGAQVTERFLWDLRQTVSELVIENYAGRLRDLAHAHGLRFTIEAYGSPCDYIPYGGRADEPMGEFWSPGAGAVETCKGMASAAHVYGKPIVGAEAFTADDGERWLLHPGVIKGMGDRVFCEGINRFVFHRYALQPWKEDRRPGMTMGPWGQHYERTQTWWELTPAWHEYLTRCQHMLRQGLFVADICYLQPEAPPRGFADHPRYGYDWDECGAEVVLTRMSVKDGRIVLPDGMSYRLLVLSGQPTMTPRLLRKIGELVKAGATVVGPPPVRSPSLTDYPACDEEVKHLADEIWGPESFRGDGNRVTEHRYGAGRVVWGVRPETLLRESGVPPDFACTAPLRHIHRRVGETDVYFVANTGARAVSATVTLRAAGKAPELWWPETGRIERAAVFDPTSGGVNVAVRLDPQGSVFIVFREALGKSDPVVTVKRDGENVIAAKPELPDKIVVEKATYGIPGDRSRTRDVRDKVQHKADTGERAFHVAEMARGDDPAPNEIKTLVVTYRVGGESHTVTAIDFDIIDLTASAQEIVVQKATYGVPGDPDRTRDVREKVQHIVDTGARNFVVARLAAGDDPAPMVVKTLTIEYTIEGKPATRTATDPETVNLVESPPKPEPPCEVREGKLIAWKPGSYTVTRRSGVTKTVAVSDIPDDISIAGPWQVAFPPGWGAPESIELDSLASLSINAVPGVKYFSGTATYRTTFNVPSAFLKKGRAMRLDLGQVRFIAQVKLNGKTPPSVPPLAGGEERGVLWKPPFRADVGGILKPGANELEVSVTNLWPNRMIGDEELPEDSERNPEGTLKSWPQWLLDGKPSPTGRHTFTSWRLWKKGDPLPISGLLGPVTIEAAQEAEVE